MIFFKKIKILILNKLKLKLRHKVKTRKNETHRVNQMFPGTLLVCIIVVGKVNPTGS